MLPSCSSVFSFLFREFCNNSLTTSPIHRLDAHGRLGAPCRIKDLHRKHPPGHFRVHQRQDAAPGGGVADKIIRRELAAQDRRHLADGLQHLGILIGGQIGAKAGLVSRALSEMRRLGVACGAKPETFNGLSGMGDLMLTCFSKQSRNRDLGERIGRGEMMAAILASHPKLAEGYPTARSAHRLAKEKNVPTPIMDEVHAMLYEGKNPKLAVRDLISRAFKAED